MGVVHTVQTVIDVVDDGDEACVFEGRVELGYIDELQERLGSACRAQRDIVFPCRVTIHFRADPELECADLRKGIIDVIER